MRKLAILVAVLALATVAAACGDDGGEGEAGLDEDTVHVSDAWARSPMPDVGAVYFLAHNGAEVQDRLIGVSSPVAGRAEIHETIERDGQMVMRPVDGVAIPPGEEVSFEPGGYHVMLFDLVEPLEVGSSIVVVLELERAGEIEVRALVEAYVPEDGTGTGGAGVTGPTGVTAPADVG